MKTARKWAWRAILTGFVGAAIFGGIGWSWEKSEHDAFLQINFDPPGQMVSAGDHEIHVVSRGEGSTGVLLISGMGDDYRTWNAVQPRLAEVTRVVSYDRPGFGWSPPREGPLSVEAALETVEHLLATPGLFEGPPILMGHSLGGVIARQFAYRHPSRVSGLILVDAPPDEMPGIANAMESLRLRVMSWMSTVGFARWRFYAAHPDLTREEELRLAYLNGASAARVREIRRELRDVINAEVFAPPQSGLGSLPLTYFVATWEMPLGFRGMMSELNAAKRLIVRESQRGKVVEAPTGHYVQYEDPDLVIAEVLEMLDTVASDSVSREGREPQPR